MSDVKNSSLATNLISYWELEEASGTRVDSHGSNDLTDNNTVGSVSAIQGDGASFVRANSEYLSISDAAQSGLDIVGDFSISLWVNFTTTDAAAIIGKVNFDAGTTARSYALEVNIGDLIALDIYGGGTGFRDGWNPSISTGTWYHLVVTFDVSAGSAELWVDGVSQGTLTGFPTSINNSTTQFEIAGNAGSGYHLNGSVDEVGIWSRILTSGEIASLYNSGAGIPYEAPPTGPQNLGTASAKKTDGTSVTVSLTGLGLQEGDVVFVAHAIGSDTDIAMSCITSGYTELTELYADDSNDANLAVYYKVMGASPDSSVEVSGSGSSNYANVALVTAYRGLDTANTYSGIATATGINSPLPTPPAVTPTKEGSIVLAMSASGGNSSGTNYTAFGNMTELGKDNADGPLRDVMVGMATFDWTSGTFTPTQWTNSIASPLTCGWCAATLVLEPIPSGATDNAIFAFGGF